MLRYYQGSEVVTQAFNPSSQEVVEWLSAIPEESGL